MLSRRSAKRLLIRFFLWLRNDILLSNRSVYLFLRTRFPGIRRKIVRIMLGQNRSKSEKELDSQIIDLLSQNSYQEIVIKAEREKGSILINELERIGFNPDFFNSTSDFTFRFVDTTYKNPSIVRVNRTKSSIEFALSERAWRDYTFQFFMPRLIIFAVGYYAGIKKILSYEADQSGVASFYICLDDGAVGDLGNLDPAISLYAFSRKSEAIQIGLVPDPYSLTDLYLELLPQPYESEASARADYLARTPKIYWRGTTTGYVEDNKLESNERIRFCMEAAKYPDLFDTKISAFIQNYESRRAERGVKGRDLWSPIVTEDEFGKYAAYVDLEGFTSAWGTFRKYLRCVHIFKPPARYSHYLDAFIGDAMTPFTSVEELESSLRSGSATIVNFDIAYRGYLSAVRAMEAVKSGDATLFPIIRR